ncbi:unnamed protein product [Rhodiola kirilowii]
MLETSAELKCRRRPRTAGTQLSQKSNLSFHGRKQE